MDILLDKNDNVLWLLGAKSAATGAYINSATVTATLKDSAGATVSGQSFPVTLSYVSGSNGNYYATLANTLVLVKGATYYAEISFDGGSNKVAFWNKELRVIERHV